MAMIELLCVVLFAAIVTVGCGGTEQRTAGLAATVGDNAHKGGANEREDGSGVTGDVFGVDAGGVESAIEKPTGYPDGGNVRDENATRTAETDGSNTTETASPDGCYPGAVYPGEAGLTPCPP